MGYNDLEKALISHLAHESNLNRNGRLENLSNAIFSNLNEILNLFND